MRAPLTLSGVLLVVAVAMPAAAQQPVARPVANTAAPSSADRAIADEVIRITKAQWQAEMAKNLQAASRNIAPDYTEFNAEYATRLEGKDLMVKLEDAGFKDSATQLVGEMINPLVQVYGNTAILTYNYVGLTQGKDGKNTPSRAKSTRVFVQQGGEWMLVHANFAADPVPTP